MHCLPRSTCLRWLVHHASQRGLARSTRSSLSSRQNRPKAECPKVSSAGRRCLPCPRRRVGLMAHPSKTGATWQCCLSGSCLQAVSHQFQLGGTMQPQLPSRRLRELVLA